MPANRRAVAYLNPAVLNLASGTTGSREDGPPAPPQTGDRRVRGLPERSAGQTSHGSHRDALTGRIRRDATPRRRGGGSGEMGMTATFGSFSSTVSSGSTA
jgi:hypothetical protein